MVLSFLVAYRMFDDLVDILMCDFLWSNLLEFEDFAVR